MYWSLRRDQLCDPNLCQDAPEDGGRCDHCPLDRLEEAEQSQAGLLMRRVQEIRAAARAGVQIGLDDILMDELQAMLILDEERERFSREQDGN